MIYNQFEIVVTSRPDYDYAYCEVSIGNYTIAEVYNDTESGRRVILYTTGSIDIDLDEFTAILDFCAYFIKKSIPKSYLEKYIQKSIINKKYIFDLYNSAISASILYILTLNKVPLKKEKITQDFIDMKYIFEKLIRLLDAGHLANVPDDVISELVHEIENANLPITKQQRETLGRYASPSSGPAPSM